MLQASGEGGVDLPGGRTAAGTVPARPRPGSRLSDRLGLVTLAAILPALLVILVLVNQLRADREREVRDLALRQTVQAVSEMQRLIEGYRTLLTAIVAAPAVRTLDAEACADYLTGIAEAVPEVSGIAVLDLGGTVRCADRSTQRGPVATEGFHVEEAQRRGEFEVGLYAVAMTQPPLRTLPFAMPLRDERGIVAGTAVIALRLEHLQAIVASWSLPEGGSLTLADREGTILARSPLPETFVGTRIPSPFLETWVKGRTGGVDEVTSQDGTVRIVAYQPPAVGAKGIYVSSGYSRDAAFAAVDRTGLWTALVAVAGVLGALAASWYGARILIQRPLGDLVSLAGAWSRGAPAPVARPIPAAEFETVALALDDMGRAIIERNAAASRQQELLVGELHHRVKNLLSLVLAIGTQTAASVGAPPAFAARFGERIQSVGRTTEMLTARHWDGVDLRDLVQSEIDAVPRGERVRLDGPVVRLPPEIAISVTLILHELATNAVKYGALAEGQEGGRLDIAWTVDEAQGPRTLALSWREHCPVPTAAPASAGFGTRLIRRTLAGIGTGGTRHEAGGLVFAMTVPLCRDGTAA
jgi:two-component sensor histidine kinase